MVQNQVKNYLVLDNMQRIPTDLCPKIVVAQFIVKYHKFGDCIRENEGGEIEIPYLISSWSNWCNWRIILFKTSGNGTRDFSFQGLSYFNRKAWWMVHLVKAMSKSCQWYIMESNFAVLSPYKVHGEPRHRNPNRTCSRQYLWINANPSLSEHRNFLTFRMTFQESIGLLFEIRNILSFGKILNHMRKTKVHECIQLCILQVHNYNYTE